MKLLARLFNKLPTPTEIRIKLKEINREQIKERRNLDIRAQTKQQKVQQAVAAKKAGKEELVRDLFRELRQVDIDDGYANANLRRLSLTEIALNSFLRKLELLERRRDREGMENLVARFNKSSLQKTIDAADVDDDTFSQMLEDIMGEEEVSATQAKVVEDAGFAEFDRTIEEIANAEAAAVGKEKPGLADQIEKADVKLAHGVASHGERVAGGSSAAGYVDKPQAVHAHIDAPLKPALSTRDTCPDCNGAGGHYVKCVCDNGTVRTTCGRCGGTGSITCPNCHGQCGPMPCPICNGAGCQTCNYTGQLVRNCPTCGNRKTIPCPDCGGKGYISSTCSQCGGKGQVWKPCDKCGGRGHNGS